MSLPKRHLLWAAACLIVLVLWARSYFLCDVVSLTSAAGNDTNFLARKLISERGSLAYVWENHWYNQSDRGSIARTWQLTRYQQSASNPTRERQYFQQPLQNGSGKRFVAHGFGFVDETSPGHAVLERRLRDTVWNRSYVVRSDFGLVMMPYWLILLLIAFPLETRMCSAARAWMRRRSGRCGKCNYDVRESPDVCPECGTPTRRRNTKSAVGPGT